MIVIGSQAFLYRMEQTSELQARQQKADYDVVMTEEEFDGWHVQHASSIISIRPSSGNKFRAIVELNGNRKLYEIEIGFEGTSAAFLLEHQDQVCDQTIVGMFGETMHTLSVPYLVLTKRSHLIYPIHWEKNINDYHTLLSMAGDFERDELMEEYYQLRFAEAKARHHKHTPKLKEVKTEDFFDTKLVVEQYFIHDHMHEIMAHDGVPMYTLMQPDPQFAHCSKEMFESLSYDQQIKCVLEESYVIALERYVVPQFERVDFTDYFACFQRALQRVCTNLTSGWFRTFAIENYPEAIKRYDPTYVERFKKAIDEGRIQPAYGKTHEDIPNFLVA